ncbi:hypothetical protein [Luteolibacter sp. Populi]|uniref:DUF4760 domain-containing protein n=1 Tax=Luteolibacter sp. Populi TaxID=3230487 RepID=UPI003465DA3E
MLPILPSLVSTAMALIALYFTIRHFKTVRTVSYIERMNHPNMADIRACVDKWLNSGRTDEERLSEIRNDPSLNARVRVFYNTLTELAIAYRYGTINRKMTIDIWDPLIPKYWEKLRFHINGSRAAGEEMGHNLEYLAHEFEKRRGKSFTFKTDPP